jgi:hypothetical protein
MQVSDKEAEDDEWTNQQVFCMLCCLLVETWHQARLSKYVIYYDKYNVELRETKSTNLI